MNSIETKLVIIFVATIFLGSTLLPALTKYSGSYLVIIFLGFMLASQSVKRSLIIMGSIFSLALEFYWGFALGSLVLPFLLSSLVFWGAGKFLNIRTDIYEDLRVSNFLIVFILTVILSATLVIIFGILQRLVYGSQEGWSWLLLTSNYQVLFFEFVFGSFIFWYLVKQDRGRLQ